MAPPCSAEELESQWFMVGNRVIFYLQLSSTSLETADWDGELAVGVVVKAERERGLTSSIDVMSLQRLVVEAQLPGEPGLKRFERSSIQVVPLRNFPHLIRR